MKKIISIFTVITASLAYFTAAAQQDAMFTQYMFNGLAINPAYAGSQEAISSNFIWRKQWLNIDGAPTSNAFSIHSPIGGNKLGAGLQLVNDKVGASNSQFANLSGSYTIDVSEDAKLSFGLSAGYNKMEYNFSDLYLGKTADKVFDPSDKVSGSQVNFGTGVYYRTKKTFVGLSIPKLLENEFTSTSENASYIQRRHAYVYAGHVFELHPNLKFKPNVLVKMTSGLPMSVDLNANFLIIDKVWLGVSYRSLESIDFIAQLNITDQLGVGYAYDHTTNQLKEDSKGSHELMVSYLFSFRKSAMLSPRYF